MLYEQSCDGWGNMTRVEMYIVGLLTRVGKSLSLLQADPFYDLGFRNRRRVIELSLLP